MCIMVLMQELIFHEMEFKLIQGLPLLLPLIQMSPLSPEHHSDLCETRPCARTFLHSPIPTELFSEQFLEPFQMTLSQPLFLRSDQLTSANFCCVDSSISDFVFQIRIVVNYFPQPPVLKMLHLFTPLHTSGCILKCVCRTAYTQESRIWPRENVILLMVFICLRSLRNHMLSKTSM